MTFNFVIASLNIFSMFNQICDIFSTYDFVFVIKTYLGGNPLQTMTTVPLIENSKCSMLDYFVICDILGVIPGSNYDMF